MNGFIYYVIDTETTGLAHKHEVIDISIIRCSDRFQLTKKIRAEYPQTASAQALEINGRSFESLLEGENRSDVVTACDTFFNQDESKPEQRCIIGHNIISFDKRFLHAMWAKDNKQFPANNWLDTMKLAKDWTKKVGVKPENYKLPAVLKFANIKGNPIQHRASADCQNTYMFWKKAMDNDVEYLTSIKRVPHIILSNEV